jgi:WD40 repeat protein
MPNLKVSSQGQFRLHWQGMLSDYVTAIAWSPKGQTLAASSAMGDVALWQDNHWVPLQQRQGHSVDGLAFSYDGQFLAAGGQNGQVNLWQSQAGEFKLIETLPNPSAWIDRLAWSPTTHHLAFGLGQYVQIWDALTNQLETNLGFEESSVWGIDWHPSGQFLALCGYQGVKVWQAQDWFADPEVLDLASASLAIAWSPDGNYLASGNMDRTLLVWEWGEPHPWSMQGFPGKVRQLAWSSHSVPTTGTPLLAASSAEGIVTWEKDPDPAVGWRATLLKQHSETVRAIAFQPDTFLLASAAEDGRLCLWQHAQRLSQVLEGAPKGFACVEWHPQGAQLAAGGRNGEVLIWSQEQRGQGFGKR